MTDFSILNFDNYQEYWRSFTTVEDFRYLPNHKAVDSVAKLGYRDSRPFYDEQQFHLVRKQVEQIRSPTVSSVLYYRQYFKGTDPALRALADREYANVQQSISTIIFLEVSCSTGFSKSGFIDFEDSLRKCRVKAQGAVNWKAIFEERKKLRPSRYDLVFYDWRTRSICSNDNEKYTVVSNPNVGLMFNHRGDHKMVPATSRRNFFSPNVRRYMIKSPLYGFMILYDHQVRKKT
ncbi:hypothetical protein KR018_005929 [Drosophila ironensis]|nr:hypothetical protein KR018_005929 [Drosophila ironensis]